MAALKSAADKKEGADFLKAVCSIYVDRDERTTKLVDAPELQEALLRGRSVEDIVTLAAYGILTPSSVDQFQKSSNVEGIEQMIQTKKASIQASMCDDSFLLSNWP
eukprot:TRINITY_DN8058_c0_g1_i1.p2 TRINITY_DN8058_c0_g1~~TRINITY_DN8058_c0_g1_i1.p2  ORF type:complete len:106 (-),score=33.06 TRINITY_DN8058_c0_g1_i1:275-592(-)